MSGVRNVVVFGRAVTNVLQNLRSTEPTFDEWYSHQVEKMRNDPLAKFMYNLRTRILKEGELRTSVSLNITGYPEAAMRRFPKPPDAKSFFIGDSIGGSGWIVQLPNGDEEKYYVNLPPDIPGLHLDVHLHFIDAPIEFKDIPVLELCKRYLQMLQDLVADAERGFRKKV